jgi:hypothetical protein
VQVFDDEFITDATQLATAFRNLYPKVRKPPNKGLLLPI